MGDKTLQTIFTKIVKSIKNPDPSNEVVLSFENLDTAAANILWQSLSHKSNHLEASNFRFCFNSCLKTLQVIMPTYAHESVGAWIVKESANWDKMGLVPNSYEDDFDVYASPVHSNFQGIYTGSHKEPDTIIKRRGQDQPRVVVETGWSESARKLGQEAGLWLGGMPNVQVVVTVKFSKIKVNGLPRVKAVLKIRRRGGILSYDVFPVPSIPVADPALTVADLYGNGTQTLPLRIQKLRDVAKDALRTMNLTAA